MGKDSTMAKATGGKSSAEEDKGLAQQSRASEITRRGVRTGDDLANLLSALLSDLIDGKVSPQVVNSECNLAGKLLKLVEMQYRHANSGDLRLTRDVEVPKPKLVRRRA
jgi:hypothetical protein